MAAPPLSELLPDHKHEGQKFQDYNNDEDQKFQDYDKHEQPKFQDYKDDEEKQIQDSNGKSEKQKFQDYNNDEDQKFRNYKDDEEKQIQDSNDKHEEQKFQDLVATLPRKKGWITEGQLHHYGGFWLPTPSLRGLLSLQQHWKPRDTHVLLASHPKAGTTWLKALLFATINRKHHDWQTHPLLTSSPHQCVPFLDLYASQNPSSPIPDLPLLAAHIPFSLLPQSVHASACPIVYICRDPKDVLVSLWHFTTRRSLEISPSSAGPSSSLAFEEAFELFCSGVSGYGPFWDHVAGYWKASKECPNRVMFLRYEDLKSQPLLHTKRLAEFVGHPFSPEEENEGVADKIIELCSFQNLSNLEVNRSGSRRISSNLTSSNSIFFRKGEVGDSKNYLTAEMAERLDGITNRKFEALGVPSHAFSW